MRIIVPLTLVAYTGVTDQYSCTTDAGNARPLYVASCEVELSQLAKLSIKRSIGRTHSGRFFCFDLFIIVENT